MQSDALALCVNALKSLQKLGWVGGIFELARREKMVTHVSCGVALVQRGRDEQVGRW